MHKNNNQSGFTHLLLIMVVAAVIMVVGLVGSNVVNKSHALGTAKEKANGIWCGGHYLFTIVKYTSAYNLSVIKEIRASLTDGGKMSVQYRWIQHQLNSDGPAHFLSTKSVTGNYTYWYPNAEFYIVNSQPLGYARLQAKCGSSTTWSSDILRLN